MPIQQKSAHAAINCNYFEVFGNQLKPQIMAQINQGMQGKSYKINKRKTLKIHKLQSISFDRCRIKGNLKVT